ALRATHVGPQPTTVPLLARVVADDAFRRGPVPTGWLEETLSRLAPPDGAPPPEALALAAWWSLRPTAGNGDPWTRRDGWRLSGRGTAHLAWTDHAGGVHACAIAYRDDGIACDWGAGPVALTHGSV